MFSPAKYIKTEDDRIIVFPASMAHYEFKEFKPVSAGFISFGTDENNDKTCKCYGESLTLNLKSNPRDTNLAKMQILNKYE